MKILFVDETSQKDIMENSSVDSSRFWNITNNWANNSSNKSIAIPPPTSYPSDVPLAIFLWIIFIVGVTGNVFLVAINIWRRSSKQAATQFFMTSLAVSDLGLLFWATWINAVLAISPSFSFGRIVCKITNLWTSLAADSSIMILSVIGIDRFLSLSKPGNCFFTARSARLMIIIVWIVVIAIDIPKFIFFDVVSYGDFNMCTIVGFSRYAVAIHSLIGRIITFFIPLGITIVCYFGIWYQIAFSKKKMTIKPGDKPENSQLLSRKVAVMCTLVVSVFIVAWTPMQIDILYLSFGSNKNQAVSLLTPLFTLANLNSCIDPIIYGFMWKPMKGALTKILGRCKGVRYDTSTDHPESLTTSVQIRPASVDA